MADFTRDDLNTLMKADGPSDDDTYYWNIFVPAGDYRVSIAYGKGMYSTPRKLVDPSEYSEVEVALFKGREWFLEQSKIPGFKWAKKFTDRSGNIAVAPYVKVTDVIEMINYLRGLVKPQQKNTQPKMGRCRRCGGYDPYIQDGDLCWRCCG